MNAKTPFFFFCYSQSVSNSWQTVADHLKTTQFTVKSLRPNTIYLFMVRAVNSHGLSDPSPISDPVRTQGILITAIFAFFFSPHYLERHVKAAAIYSQKLEIFRMMQRLDSWAQLSSLQMHLENYVK